MSEESHRQVGQSPGALEMVAVDGGKRLVPENRHSVEVMVIDMPGELQRWGRQGDDVQPTEPFFLPPGESLVGCFLGVL